MRIHWLDIILTNKYIHLLPPIKLSDQRKKAGYKILPHFKYLVEGRSSEGGASQMKK